MAQKKKTSKQDKVLSYLKTHKKGISQAQAIDKFHAYRLSSIIFRLRKSGYKINTTMWVSKDKDGYTSNYAVYTLVA